MRPSAALTSALLLSSTCLAWPFDWDTLQAIKREIAPILKRVPATSYNLSFTPTSGTQGNTAPTATPDDDGDSTDATTTADDASQTGTATGTDSNTGTITPAPTKSSGGSKSNSNTTATLTQYDPRLPAGGISMITPNPYTTQYYKILTSNTMTLAWNYTSVSLLPSAVDILAVGAKNAATWTLALNQSVSGPSQTFMLDLGSYNNNASTKLVTQSYTLIVYDAAKDVSATPSPGYLGTSNQFTFGMYLPQPYSSEEQGWQCVTCSGAMGLERQALFVVLGMAGITVLSFTWFTGMVGLW